MRRLLILVILFLVAWPASCPPGGSVDFHGGCGEATVALTQPAKQAFACLTVPAGLRVLEIHMNVTGLPAEDDGSAFPENVSIMLNGTEIWGFRGIGFGALGKQDRFSTGSKVSPLQFWSGGGTKIARVRLPKEARVESASMDVKATVPKHWEELFNVTGNAPYDQLTACAFVGDVNGDGYDDVLMGATGNSSNPFGYVYLYYGRPCLDSSPDLSFHSSVNSDGFGGVISGAGDVNGDGYDDLLIGAPRDDKGGNDTGRAYLFFGGRDMDNCTDLILSGEAEGDGFGGSVSGAGDVNGDGYEDVVVGARGNDAGGPYAGRAYLYLGGPGMDSVPEVIFTGVRTSYLGYSTAAAGDVNGDGFDDVIIGAPGTDISGNEGAGQTHVFFGGAPMNNKADVTFNGSTYWDELGRCVCWAGDLNDDGFDDVAVGAFDWTTVEAGRVEVFFGGRNMDSRPDAVLRGSYEMDFFGWDISGAGDVNDDGYDDLLIGAHGNESGGWNFGRAYIFYGGQAMDDRWDAVFDGTAQYEWLGICVSGGGDVNQDGSPDLLISADEEMRQSRGCVHLYTQVADAVPGPLDPAFSIGLAGIWSKTGNLNGSATMPDFARELNEYLRSTPASGSDGFGNSYVNVPLSISARNEANLSLRKLTVKYGYDARVPDFARAFNDHMENHTDNGSCGNISMPLLVRSDSPGRVRLSGIDMRPDQAPAQVKDIGTVGMDEDTAEAELIDLYPFFKDDSDPDGALDFSLVSATNSAFVRVAVAGNRYVSADALSGDANDNWTGTVEAVVACSDHWGQRTVSGKFRIVVRNVNDPPVITSAPVQRAEAAAPYLYSVVAIDGDRDELRFSLPRAPANMTIDASSGEIRWLPRTRGSHNVVVAVSDGMEPAQQSFTVSVPNRPPRILSEPPPTATTGALYIYNLSAEDDNSDRLAFSLESFIEGMAVNATGGSLSWTPVFPGDYDVVVKVSDGEEWAFQGFTICVRQCNRAPRFTSLPARTATAGLAYEYLAQASDEDQDDLNFSILAGPTGMTVDSASGLVGWTPGAPGSFAVQIKVEDDRGGRAVQAFQIAVAELTRPRVIIDRPTENENLRGNTTFSGTALRGTLEVLSVELRIDGGEWSGARGNHSWHHGIDTTRLSNGKHRLEARASDGTTYSDTAERTFSVDNRKAAARVFIPGFAAVPAILAAVLIAMLRRRGGL